MGNEIAARLPRLNLVLTAMSLSAISAAIVGFMAPLPWLVVVTAVAVYTVFVMGDSAALTNGVIFEARPHLRGATMAVHSFLGFRAGMIPPPGFGAGLDLTRG